MSHARGLQRGAFAAAPARAFCGLAAPPVGVDKQSHEKVEALRVCSSRYYSAAGSGVRDRGAAREAAAVATRSLVG